MKRILLIIILLSFSLPIYAQNIRNLGETYRQKVTINDIDGDHVGSKTIVLKIQRDNDGYNYDFDDDTFKPSGWTTETTNLTEDTVEGFYYSDFTQPTEIVNTYTFVMDLTDDDFGFHTVEDVYYIDDASGVSDWTPEERAEILRILNRIPQR